MNEAAKPTSIIVARTDIERFHASLLETARLEFQGLDSQLQAAHEALSDLENGPIEERMETAASLADRIGLPEQARSYRVDRSRRIGQLRRRVGTIARRHSQAKRILGALEAGYMPMPRFPALTLEFCFELIPVEAIEAMGQAHDSGLFDEFRIVDGRDATPWGTPRTSTSREARAKQDPILVGMIGREMFPLAWWR